MEEMQIREKIRKIEAESINSIDLENNIYRFIKELLHSK